jgi:hypothetical protein
MTDFLALANEAICYEGSDTYLGATSEQLADMLAANQDLWTPSDRRHTVVDRRRRRVHGRSRRPPLP